MSQQQRKRTKHVVVVNTKSKHDQEELEAEIIEATNSVRSPPEDDNDSESATGPFILVAGQDAGEQSNKCSASLIENEEDLQTSSQTTATTTINTRNMLIHYGKEVLCLLAVLLTTLASYQGSTPKVGRPPSPQFFFPAGSMVHDHPAGNLDAVSQQVSLSELSFVFYYAPWDGSSQGARKPYADVAKYYHREAFFSAINCWQPGGECSLQYSKIKAWPVLMAYLPKNGLGVLYNGPWERDPMMRFVNSFLRPLKRLNDPDDLLQEMTAHDAIVVAFLDMQQDLTEWNLYYEAAVKWMYRDPFQDIRFSIVTGESRSKFGIDTSEPVLRMYLWNETIEYENKTWSTAGIESWSLQHVHRVALWMTPTGYKSMTMSSFFKNGPVLLFFTPRNMLKESTDAMEMMRQIGMEYYNCQRDEWIREMVREYLPEQRRQHQEELKRLRNYCQGVMSSMVTLRRPVSVTFANLINGSSQQQQQNHQQQQQLHLNERISDICQLDHSSESFFGGVQGEFEEEAHCEKESCGPLKGNRKLRETSMLRSEFDRRSPKNLHKHMMRRKCESLFIDTDQAVNSFLGQKPFEVEQLQAIEAMGCTGNRSLTMLLMDSSIYHVFAERLGVDILTKKRRSGVLIVDPENESTYMLNPNEEDLMLKSISRFIRKFSDGTLRRHLRSSHLDYSHTHFYSQPVRPAPSDRRRRIIEIEELNSKNFASTMATSLSTSPPSLLVYFYSANCAFCTMMSQHLLQISNVLRPLSEAGHLKIVRIDGDKNDLSWPFTVAEYPSLIFFSGRSAVEDGIASDSRQFVISERNSVALDKILGFLIANLNRPLRIYAIELTCAASRRSVKSLVNCLASLRAEIHDGISASLRELRMVGNNNNSRTRILRRLQLLEAFYLETFRVSEANQCQSCDFTKLEGYCRRIVAVWKGEGNSRRV